MIKILNIFQILEGLKVFLELIGMIVKGIQEGMQHFRNKNNKPGKSSATAPEENNPKEE